MSFINLFAPSTSALYGNATAFKVIGDNIANATTPGYKAADTRFAELLTPTVNAINDFYGGIRPTVQNFIDKQGTVEQTQRPFDIALVGRGFLVSNTAVDGSGQYELGRAGQLISTPVGNGTDESYLTDTTGNFILGWEADAYGNFTPGTSVSSLTPIRVDPSALVFDPVATTIGDYSAILPAEATAGTVRIGSMPVVDAAGAEHAMSLQFTKSATPYTWDLAVSVSNGTVTSGGTATMTFDVDGTLLTPTSQSIGITFSGAGGATSVALDLSGTRELGGNQFTTLDYSQNGIVDGTLQSLSFDQDGVLTALFTNGQSRPVYKLAVGIVPSPDLLEPVDGTHFALSAASGDISLVDAAATDMISFVPGALEQSTTDLATEFTKMIETQRSYSTAVRAYTVADEMTRVASQLKA